MHKPNHSRQFYSNIITRAMGKLKHSLNAQYSLEKFNDTNVHVNLILLQIRSTLLGPGLPSPKTLLFKHSIRGIKPVMSRSAIYADNDNDHFEAVVYVYIVYICIYANMYVGSHTYVYVCMQGHKYIYYPQVCIYICFYACTCMHI